MTVFLATLKNETNLVSQGKRCHKMVTHNLTQLRYLGETGTYVYKEIMLPIKHILGA